MDMIPVEILSSREAVVRLARIECDGYSRKISVIKTDDDFIVWSEGKGADMGTYGAYPSETVLMKIRWILAHQYL